MKLTKYRAAAAIFSLCLALPLFSGITSVPAAGAQSTTPTPAASHTATGSPVAAPTAGPTATPVGGISVPVPLPGNGSRFFPQTGKTVSGLFLDYWSNHGGLAQQGYPTSDLMGEVSDLDHKLYTVQYFERAVFEYHPENQAPYDVLLSQLGTLAYKARYPQGAPNQQANTSQGSMLFAPTNHRVGGRFLEYWQSHGGLAQQGYPISEEFIETSALNGKPYKVQYFERAVFEYHPENPAPYDVLLSQLGKFKYDARYGAGAAHLAPLPGADLVAGHYIFWQTQNGELTSINGYDLQQKSQFTVTTSLTNKTNLAADNRHIVWTQDCPPSCERIRGYDLQAHREFAIVEPSGRQFSKLFLDGDMLYFEETDAARAGLYGRNIITAEERRLTAGGFSANEMFQPVIENGLLIYSKGSDANNQWQLHIRPLDDTLPDTVINTALRGYTAYHSWGNYVVWSVYPESQTQAPALFAYDIGNNQTRQLDVGPAYSPMIHDTTVAWTASKWTEGAPTAGPHGPISAVNLIAGKKWTVVPDRSSDLQIVGIADNDQLILKENVPQKPTTDYYSVPLSGSGTASTTPQKLTDNLAGGVTGYGSLLFWDDRQNGAFKLLGFDNAKNRKFEVPTGGAFIGGLATDGKKLAWISGDVEAGGTDVRLYDIASGATTVAITSTTASPRSIASLAVDGSKLYYVQAVQNMGLYQSDLSGNNPALVSAAGRDPVAADGVLLWTEQHPAPSAPGVYSLASNPPPYNPTSCTLHMREQGGTSDTVIAEYTSPFAGDCLLSDYRVSGNTVVYMSQMQPFIYNITTHSSKPISQLSAYKPLVNGHTAAWTGHPDPSPGGPTGTEIVVYNTDTGSSHVVIPATSALPQAEAVLSPSSIAYSLSEGLNQQTALYVLSISAP